MKTLKIFSFAFSIIFFTSCSNFTKLGSSDSNTELPDYIKIYQANLKFEPSFDRQVAALTCEQLLDRKAVTQNDPQFAKRLMEDPFARVEAEMNTATGGEKYPINLSNAMRKFRDRFLGYIKNMAHREPLTRSFEASLRMQSHLVEANIRRNNNYAQYDIVIVGTGVHGIIALHQAVADYPNAKILLVDEGDTAGATFRYGKEVFSINSSNRRSGVDTRPLPGEGNINELPGLPIQVSDLTNVKYPTANDLGTALVSGLYSAVRENPNVDVLFNSRADFLLEKPRDSKLTESLQVSAGTEGKPEFQIDAQKIIFTTGLGDPNIPEKIVKSITDNPKLVESKNGKLPRVLTFEDLLRLLAASNNPAKLIKDLRIGIVGKGDSANVLIEFLLGYAAREGYAQSSAQDGRAAKIVWIGQEKQTCRDFISDIRSRYQGVSTGLRSSSPNIEAIISPKASRISDVSEKGPNEVSAQLEDGTQVDLDVVVLTTGFDKNIRELFKYIGNRESTNYGNDKEFFDDQFQTMTGTTSVSLSPTKIGRKLNDREIYVLGTAAGQLAENKDLVGIVQNFVSIFNNAPRVVSSMKKIMNDFKPIAERSKSTNIMIGTVSDKQSFTVTGVQESRYMLSQTIPYLETTFREALSYTTNPKSKSVVFEVTLLPDGNLRVDSQNLTDTEGVMNLLSQSREFFSLTKELLKSTKGQSLFYKANAANGKFNLTKTSVVMVKSSSTKSVEGSAKIQNQQIKLRGLRDRTKKKTLNNQTEVKAEVKKDDKKDEPPTESREGEFVAYNENGKINLYSLFKPEIYYKKAIFQTIPDGNFVRPETSQLVSFKSFELMATPMTQLTWAKVFNAKGTLLGTELVSNLAPSPPGGLQTEFTFGDTKVLLSDRRPVTNITRVLTERFLEVVNNLSKSDLEQAQDLMEENFPGHKKGDVYDIPSDVEYTYVSAFAIADGQSIGGLQSSGQLSKYEWIGREVSSPQPVATKLPRLINGKPFYDLNGNVQSIVKGLPGQIKLKGSNYALPSALAGPTATFDTADQPLAVAGIRLTRRSP